MLLTNSVCHGMPCPYVCVMACLCVCHGWHALVGVVACHYLPWWVPWHVLVGAMTCHNASTRATNDPNCASKLFIGHLE
jgi:hypothetical protein